MLVFGCEGGMRASRGALAMSFVCCREERAFDCRIAPRRAGSPRGGIWRGIAMVCSRRERMSSWSASALLSSRRRPNAHTSSSSSLRSPFSQRSRISSHTLLPCSTDRATSSSKTSRALVLALLFSRLSRIPLRMTVKVRVSGAPFPRSGNLAVTPNKASISLHRAHTFNTAFVCIIEGLTGALSANIEW